MKILVIEDEAKTASYIQRGLEENGFEVDLAGNGDDGLRLALANPYDLIIVDVMLPGRDGWSLVSELRKGGNSTFALFLTARDTINDRIKGLELGGDAYLVKPFVFSELMAHVRTLLRRGQARPPEVIQIQDLQIDLIQHRVMRSHKKVDLTPIEFQLLSLLARRAGEILSRTTIAEKVWDMKFDSDTNVVDVAVRRLRVKIESQDRPKLIHTVRGMGYVLRDDQGA